MRKRFLFLPFGLAVLSLMLSCKRKDLRVVKEGCYVPLFDASEVRYAYEVGAHGTNCDHLDTVLLPKMLVEVVGSSDNQTSKVKWRTASTSDGTVPSGEGFIHDDFLKSCCRKAESDDASRQTVPMPLAEIRSIFARCIKENVPYCWGGNQFEAIKFPKAYDFISENNTKAYECRGFDCSGILYFVSNGLLPHSTGQLRNYGKILHLIKSEDAVSPEGLRRKLNDLRDTDYIVLKGHVVVWFNNGILEFRSKDLGCCFTPAEEAVRRVTELVEAARKKNTDVRFVRWHPEVMQAE